MFPPQLSGSRMGGNCLPLTFPVHSKSPHKLANSHTERENTSHPFSTRLSSLLSALLGCHRSASTLASSFIPAEHSTGTTTGPEVPRARQPCTTRHSSHPAQIWEESDVRKGGILPPLLQPEREPRGAAGKSKKGADGQVPHGQVPHRGAKINKTSFELLPNS